MAEEQKKAKQDTAQQKEELAAYGKLRADVRKILGEVRDTINSDTIKSAVDRAAKELKEVGDHTSETISKVANTLKKDLASAAERMGPKWEKFSDKTADLFGVWRDRGSIFLGHAAQATGEWLREIGSKLEHQGYHTGETIYGGTFECTACGEHVMLQKPGHLPPCPKCFKTEFRRI